MALELSQRLKDISPSGSIQIALQISKLRDEGKNIIGLNVGEPDFKAPSSVIAATIKALKSGKTKYSLVSGESVLREAISENVNKKDLLKTTKNNILIGNGSKQIIYNVFQAILNPGDEVIVPVPYWVTIPESVKLAGGIPKLIDTNTNFSLNIENIQNAISEKTKAIYINTPNNPTGVVYNTGTLKELCKLAKEHNLYIISDEAYETLSYDFKFTTPASLDNDAFSRTIIIRSFSKTFCMTGFRLGYMIANEQFINNVDKFQGHLCGNVAPFTQYGALEALHNEDSITKPIIKDMCARRDLSYKLFSKIFPCHKPEGAFYLFMDISPYIASGLVKDDIEMVNLLINKANVALVPGSSFGKKNYIRLAYTAEINQIKEAFESIRGVLT